MATTYSDSLLVYQHDYLHKSGRDRENTNIDTVLIRCLSYDTLTELFNYYDRSERGSHYLIDQSGYIGQLVKEQFASELFQDSKLTYEKRLISITIGTYGAAGIISDKLRSSLKELLEDICRRNHIEKLTWSAQKADRLARTDGCNVLMYSDIEADESNEAVFKSDCAKTLFTEVNAILEEAAAESEQNQDTDTTLPTPAGGNVNTASLVSKDKVVAKNEYLKDSEKEINARYIWQYLGSRNWTLNAVAGLLGNMERESTINPGLWQNFAVNVGPAFGLTQWDPFSKIINWMQRNEPSLGYPKPIEDIDGQLEKLLDEVDICGKSWVEGRSQWIATDAFPFSFQDFTRSTEAPEYLAEAFLKNYERAGVEALQDRKDWAIKWYNFLLPFSNLNPPTAVFLRITDIGDDYIVARCELENIATTTTFRLNVLDTEGEVISKDEYIAEHEETEAIFVVTGLTPDTSYTLEIQVNPVDPEEEEEPDTNESDTDTEEAEDEQIIPIISFKTKPGRPNSVESVTISPQQLPLHDQTFTVNIIPPTSWGYWVEKGSCNSYGYTLQLIVQGEILATKDYNHDELSLDFTFVPTTSEIFDSVAVSAGQTIQLGVSTWINIASGIKLHNNCAKASNAICLINNKHRIFIPQDK